MTDWEALTNRLRRVPLFADIKDEDNVVRQLQGRFFARWRRVFATSKVQRDNKKSWLRSERCPPVSRMN